MKALFKTKKGIACIAAVCVLLAAAAVFGGYQLWDSQRVKFHDVTVELGVGTVSVQDFMTEYARADQVAFVSDVSTVNLYQIGQTPITLRHGRQQQTVTLTVQDTTAPKAEFLPHLTAPVNNVPEAGDFVVSAEDASQIRVYYEHPPVIPADYSDETVTVVVEDAAGNQTRQECTISYQWLRETYALELGQVLTLDDLLFNPQRDAALLDSAEIDLINSSGPGTYTLSGTIAGKTVTCTVTVQDTLGPDLVLRDVQRYPGSYVVLNNFVESVDDVSGVADVRFVSEPSCSEVGIFTVVIEAEDIYGNITRKEATLWVGVDRYGPQIHGAETQLTVEKYSTPDLLDGVTATDASDGVCQVAVDAANLDTGKAGTYYITYSATDSDGNVTTQRRRVIVLHDESDTHDLVNSIAAELSDDPEEIRNFVRYSILYSSSWGDDDPVWYGFTKRSGNCYVHAVCLQALFDAKGIECQLIWATDKSHYWLIVNIDGTWWHIDPTPSEPHNYYSLMNDQQRLDTLWGRTWDTEAWPACG